MWQHNLKLQLNPAVEGWLVLADNIDADAGD